MMNEQRYRSDVLFTIARLMDENEKLRSDTIVNDYANAMEEVAYLKQENEKLREELEALRDVWQEAEEDWHKAANEMDAWKELCGRWVEWADMVARCRPHGRRPPEKPEGV